MVMVSSPTRTSLTKSRTIRWRSVTLSVSEALRKRARNAVRVSARRRNAARSLVWSANRLELSTECSLALTQPRHALAQLLDRQESFLIGIEKSFDTFADLGQLPLQTLLTFPGWIGRARGCQATIEFLLYQSWLFQQSDHFGPDDLIQELLSDETAVVAN